LTLAGTDTLAHYQQVLESVTFSSTSFNADNSGVNPTRTIQWQVNDGSAANNLSAVQTTTLTINALDDSTITDVNGDGRGDVLLQNDNGQPAVWLMNGLTVTSQTNVGTNPGPQWDEIGAGDFNGDHRSDLLFQHDNGTPGIWLMNGTTVLATANPGSPVLWSPQWNVISSGDFNGDGKSDILWQNNNSTPGIWLMDGTNVVAHDAVGSPALWSPAWHVIGSGDFNGDNKADILWQNNNGSAGVWLMDGLTVLSHNVIDGVPGAAWHVIGAGDFNADGKSDILWQNNNGTPAIWLMNGLNVTSMATPGTNPGPSWNVIGANDLNGDGFSDIVWQNDNGQPGGWLMNGTTVLATNFLDANPGPTWDVIPAHDLV
jgi:serralysin